KGVTTGGDSVPVVVLWSARFGTITPDGLYTAPASGQKDVVTARATGPAYLDSAVISLVALPVGEVDVTPGSATLFTGELAQLTAVVLNTKGETVHTPVVWASSAPTVASVTQ